MEQDQDTLGNPYNHFQRPIEEKELFVGREEEIEDICYSLDQAVSDRREFLNIGITGKTGAGKTSLSYILEDEAKDRDLLPVRIELDDYITSDETKLLKKIYEEIVSSIGGKSEEGYLNALKGNISEVELNAKLLKLYFTPGEDSPETLSEGLIKRSFVNLYRESDVSGITLILDDAQHLARNPTILQKFKNIFSGIDGYILVLVGTENTFSEISSAFSPAARIFNKFRIGPFESYEKAKECIVNPLNEEEKDNIDEKSIYEIYNLTGGSPYEINLLCYHMYKNFEKDGDDFSLSSDVIDEVLNQLEEWRRTTNNQITNEINDLSEETLEVLVSALETSPSSRDKVVEYSLLDQYKSTETIREAKQRINESIDELISRNILENDSQISFCGDYYEVAYIKYFLISNGILDSLGTKLQGEKRGYISNVHYRIVNNRILSDIEDCHTHFLPDREGSYNPYVTPVSFETVPEQQQQQDIDYNSKLSAFADRGTQTLDEPDFYKSYSKFHSREDNNEENETYPTVQFRCNIEWLDTGFVSIIHIEDEERSEEIKREIQSRIETEKSRLIDTNYELIIDDERSLISKTIDLLQKGEIEDAVNISSKAIEVNEDYPLGWYYNSFANFNHGEDEENEKAINSINKCIEIIDDWPPAYILKSKIHFERNESDKQEIALERAKNINPDDEYLLLEIACVFGRAEKHKKEKEYAEMAINQGLENNHVYFHAGTGCMHSENHDDAMFWYEKVLNSDSDDRLERSVVNSASCARKMDNNILSLKLAGRYIEKFDKNIRMCKILQIMAKNLIDLGYFDASLSCLEKIQSINDEFMSQVKDSDDYDRIRDMERFRQLVSN